ncbi:MAG TPA: ABC transporter ATP-binding protein [Candidatus Aphodocola excrementigallinarum]|uniref:ABC transporter ATP-binding protein n=1 Tax=Candidatus Aphodocola excrementigallinarum TaxID=2840670 RepID=A0A9D1IQH0_9FIRM|nr:ABC transporter ATP-binding protein [Candidatus Aphodocola excrementigallinarum]
MMNAIEIKSIKKTYKDFKLDINNLKVQSGTITGLIGENGAGKTTLIKSILGMIKSNCKNLKIFNKDYKENENEIKDDIGLVLDNAFFPELLNAKDINTIMKGIYKNWDEKLFFKYLKEFNLSCAKEIKSLSCGMKKKLEIITALSHHPKLLILDEPTSGLDPVARSEVLDILLKFIKDEDHTVLLSTHITTDLEHTSDQIIFIDDGKIVLDEQKDNVINDYGILKCDHSYFDKISKNDVLAYKKNKYNTDVLIKDKERLKKKYKDVIIDNVTLEDLMILMIKGDKLS